jgi:hypothetical protein
VFEIAFFVFYPFPLALLAVACVVEFFCRETDNKTTTKAQTLFAYAKTHTDFLVLAHLATNLRHLLNLLVHRLPSCSNH